MEIRRLEREIYAGRAFTARYRSNGYYDIGVSEDGFPIRYLPFAAPEERSFEDVFFSAWLEDPVAFGAFEGGELLGFAEGSPEGWNRRFQLLTQYLVVSINSGCLFLLVEADNGFLLITSHVHNHFSPFSLLADMPLDSSAPR